LHVIYLLQSPIIDKHIGYCEKEKETDQQWESNQQGIDRGG